MGVEPTQDLVGPDTVLKTAEAAGPLPSPRNEFEELARSAEGVEAEAREAVYAGRSFANGMARISTIPTSSGSRRAGMPMVRSACGTFST